MCGAKRKRKEEREVVWGSKVVMEKSRGAVPLRGGSRVERTPRYMACLVQMGTMKKRQPRSSPETMRRAMTTATLGMPKAGVVAGIHLWGELSQTTLVRDANTD